MIDKYVRKRKRATWTDAATGDEWTLEEATGRDGIKLLDMSMAMAKSGQTSVEAGGMIPFFVEAIAISVVESDGSRPLDTPEGRAVIADWPMGMLMNIGQAAIDLQGLGTAKKN